MREQAERLCDEMAVVLCGVAELGDDVACIRALRLAGFPDQAIVNELARARGLARCARTVEREFWIRRAHP